MPPRVVRFRVEFRDPIMNTWRTLSVEHTRKDAETQRKLTNMFETRMKEEE